MDDSDLTCPIEARVGDLVLGPVDVRWSLSLDGKTRSPHFLTLGADKTASVDAASAEPAAEAEWTAASIYFLMAANAKDDIPARLSMGKLTTFDDLFTRMRQAEEDSNLSAALALHGSVPGDPEPSTFRRLIHSDLALGTIWGISLAPIPDHDLRSFMARREARLIDESTPAAAAQASDPARI